MSSESVQSQRALVIGEALIDIVERVGSAEEPTEVVGGSPANVALGLSRLGVATTLLTHLAHDERGERIASQLQAEGVEIGEETFTAERTATAHALITPDGAADYTFDISWDITVPDSVAAPLVHAGSLALFLEPGAQKVLSLVDAVAADAVVSLDPNIRPNLLPVHQEAVERFERLAAHAHVIKLSDEDAEWLYPGVSMPDVAGHLRGLGATLVVVTLGAEGALARAPGTGQGSAGQADAGQVFSAVGAADDAQAVDRQAGDAARQLPDGDILVRVPIQPGPLVDTISAGDSFMASLLASVLRHGLDACVADVEGVLRRASCASAIAVSKAGANPPSAEALEALEAGDISVLG
ncbi:MAG: PfkB family carbohydrate kinase [Galactobacter sp.]